jgi:hypothetical protein
MRKLKTGDKVILNKGRHSSSEMEQYVGNVATVRSYMLSSSYFFEVEENKFWWDDDTCELVIDFKGMLPEEEFADA